MVVGPSELRLCNVLGPGLVTGASDGDPSRIATYSHAWAQLASRCHVHDRAEFEAGIGCNKSKGRSEVCKTGVGYAQKNA